MNSFQTLTANQSLASPKCMTTRQTFWGIGLAFPLIAGPVWCFAWQSFGHWLGTLAGLVLSAVLLTSAITDLRRHRIYNWATYSAFLWALLINLGGALLSSSEATMNKAYHRAASLSPELLGSIGLSQCLAGAAICFLITLFGYRLSGSGAGDVKLATVIGALLGVKMGVFAVAYSYIVAAVAILAWSTWVNGPLAIARAAFRRMGAAAGPYWPFPPSAQDHKLLLRPIPLGPYFAIGTFLVVFEVVL